MYRKSGNLPFPSHYWEPQPEAEEELEMTADAHKEKMKTLGIDSEEPAIPFE